MNRRMWLIALLVLHLTALACTAETFEVGPGTGAQPGNELDIPTAWYLAGPEDTLLLLPGTHIISPEATWPHCWPLWLDDTAPWIVGRDGSEATVVIGWSDEAAFTYWEGSDHGILRVEGVTFRDFGEFVHADDYCDQFYRPNFRDCEFDDCGMLDLSCCWGSVSDCRIRNSSSFGIKVFHFNGTISDCEICDNAAAGILGTCCEEPLIQGNHIHHNGGCGIRVGYNLNARNNLIEHNGTHGIEWSGCGTGMFDNVVRWNGVGVYLDNCSGNPGPFVHNDIYENAEYNVECSVYSCTAIADFSDNWWGTTDPDAIAASIRDCNDDPAIDTCVEFEPFCDAPGCEPVAVEAKSWSAIKAMYR